MNKQSISFKANEQKLTKTGGIEHYASNIVAYIEATFDLGTNWSGYDSVRAVWSNDYLTDISTVLDSNGKCIVPTEVLTDTGNVTVNLVGSIADGDTLTDRLTTYPCKAVIVDADAKVEGEETENITPSQFEQFVEIVHDEVEQVTGMTAEAETLPAGSSATASYSDGVLSLGIPRGDKGEQGEQGETGHTGAPAGFGNVTASVDNTVGTPSVVVNTSGPDTAKEFDFQFHNLKGDKGDTGDTGATGNGIASTVLNPDYTLTITFTDGTHYTTPSIRGAKGDTGNTGATGNGIQSTVLNADYTLTITFTDGTSYTTPSIRGEQGPAGPVSDVTVNGTSVVDQNGVAVITMPELVKTVNGNPIVIDDAFGEVKKLDVELLPIQDLHGYSKPWAAGAGTNKFDESTLVQGNYTYEGPASTENVVTHGYLPIKGGITYMWSQTGYTNGRYIRFYDANQEYDASGDVAQYNTSNATFNAPQWAVYMRVMWYKTGGITPDDIKALKPQIEEGSTATTWTPYSNICPITGHDSVTVTDTGVNQWDEEWELGSLNVSTGTDKTDASKIRSKNYIPVSDSKHYYMKCTNNVYACCYDKNKNYLVELAKRVSNNASEIHNTEFYVPANTCYIRFYVESMTTYNNDISVNLPSTDTAYHAYYGQSKTVTLPHTVYGAGVGVTSGNGKEKMAIVDMGTLGWSYSSGYMISNSLLQLVKRPPTWATVANILCTIYKADTADNVVAGTSDNTISITPSGSVYARDSRYPTAEAFKTAMSGVYLCYELATPTDLSTTPTDITLYNGDNVISSDGDMELSYVQDMATVIRKIENQL